MFQYLNVSMFSSLWNTFFLHQKTIGFRQINLEKLFSISTPILFFFIAFKPLKQISCRSNIYRVYSSSVDSAAFLFKFVVFSMNSSFFAKFFFLPEDSICLCIMHFLTLTNRRCFTAEFTDELWNPAKVVAIQFSGQKAFVGLIQQNVWGFPKKKQIPILSQFQVKILLIMSFSFLSFSLFQ